jgi:hypothetical protein
MGHPHVLYREATVHPPLAELVKVVGGVNLLRELGEAISAIEKNPGQDENSNMYFILRVSQEVDH